MFAQGTKVHVFIPEENRIRLIKIEDVSRKMEAIQCSPDGKIMRGKILDCVPVSQYTTVLDTEIGQIDTAMNHSFAVLTFRGQNMSSPDTEIEEEVEKEIEVEEEIEVKQETEVKEKIEIKQEVEVKQEVDVKVKVEEEIEKSTNDLNKIKLEKKKVKKIIKEKIKKKVTGRPYTYVPAGFLSEGDEIMLSIHNSFDLLSKDHQYAIKDFLQKKGKLINGKVVNGLYPVKLTKSPKTLPNAIKECCDITVEGFETFAANRDFIHIIQVKLHWDLMFDEFLNLKNYAINPERIGHGWCSNNTVVIDKPGADYSTISELIQNNGEPGVFWINNARNFSRMGSNPPDNKDTRVEGTNPCLPGDTMILTDKGIFPITELVGKQFNAVVDGKIFPSTKEGFFKTGTKELLKITLENGASLRATADHKILTTKGYVEAGKLEKGVELQISDICDYTEIKFQDNDKKQELEKRLDEYASKYLQNYDSFTKVISVEKDNTEDVYDCTINNIHRFSANGVLVSNCSEQSLESYELCCLVEVFLNNHDTIEEYLDTLKYAYLYSKTVTLGKTHWVETNRVLLRNRRIGTSLTGIAQFLARRNNNIAELKQWLIRGYDNIQKYDKIYSEFFAIPRSIKTTTVKPSGCMLADTEIIIKSDNCIIKSDNNTDDKPVLHKQTLSELFKSQDVHLDIEEKSNTADKWFEPKDNIKVLDANNHEKNITKLYIKGKSNGYKITFDDNTSVICSNEHQFMTLMDGEGIFVESERLSKGMKVKTNSVML